MRNLTPQEIAKRAEAYFGEQVCSITAPGGKRRGSCRIHFETTSIIASSRDNLDQTNYEAFILQQIQQYSNACPRLLGQDNELLFQSDVGDRRLGQQMHNLAPNVQENLADDAIAALFDIHQAARKVNFSGRLRQLGATTEWVDSFVTSIDKITRRLGIEPIIYDKAAICEFMGTPAIQFVKWDCRAGNAAIDPKGTIRWFDFEYAGLRHGAEDFSWFIADENWPLSPETMLEIIKDRFPSDDGREWDDYQCYLETYTSLHAIQRLLLIVDQAKRKGWISETNALRDDYIGTNPRLAIRLCSIGATLAERNKFTFPLTKLFEDAAEVFRKTIR